MMSLFSLTLTLFLIMDPLGKVKQFLAILDGIPHRKQRFVIAREMVMALVAMLSFSLLGEYISAAFQVNMTTIFISAGVILFLTALRILFPKEEHVPHVPGNEPFLVPLAIPMIASPALLATIMLFSQAEPLMWPMISSILMAWAISSILLIFSRPLKRLLTQNGLLAIERLMGMVLVLIAVQRFLEGVVLFVTEHH